MRKISLTFTVLIILGFITAISCGKTSDSGSISCTTVDPVQDSSALLTFARANGITPVKDTTGLYYQIINQGTGATPTGSSVIYVTYSGSLLNGTVFDSTSNSASTGFTLGNLIAGWQIGIPKIQVGGRIKLLIPSAYGYGCLGSGPIPSNAPIYFDVTLVSIK
jgi:FKBP-type peptidyl-prolyl cis-trans isomerase FkpA